MERKSEGSYHMESLPTLALSLCWGALSSSWGVTGKGVVLEALEGGKPRRSYCSALADAASWKEGR